MRRILFLLCWLWCLIGAGERAHSGDRHREDSDKYGRFLTIVQYGDGEDHKAQLRVFEEIGEGTRFRKLHEIELLNPIGPLMVYISPDGRFVVTLDDVETRVVGPRSLVVYDLVRREYSAWSAKEFLSESLLVDLTEKLGAQKCYGWKSGKGAFNRSSTKYFPTRPEGCRKEGVPFISIDLVARSVSVLPIPEADPPDLDIIGSVKTSKGLFYDMNSWSDDDFHETAEREPDSWPKYLRRSWPKDKPSQVYEYDAASGDYVRTSDDKWGGKD